MKKANIVNNNFDLLRLTLALIVVLFHIGQLKELAILESLQGYKAVEGFFVISGFLIFMSFERSKNLADYVQKRVKRIYPAYFFVVVFFSVFLVFFSSYPAESYFTSVEFWKYLISNLTFLTFMKNTLPGVFENHVYGYVNGPLWTIRVEVFLYVTVPIIGFMFKFFDKKKGLITLYLLLVFVHVYLDSLPQKPLISVLAKQMVEPLLFFISGVILYFYHKYLNTKYLLAALIGVSIYYLTDVFYIYPISLATILIYIALKIKYLGNWGKYGDISYGIYIWHYPIIQMFISLKICENSPMCFILCTLICVVSVAFLSWNFIEKPFLNKKSHYVVAENASKD